MKAKLASGINLICDRYAFSGVAYTSAKVILFRLYFTFIYRFHAISLKHYQGVDLEWCKGCDAGIMCPDAVVHLLVDSKDTENREGYARRP